MKKMEKGKIKLNKCFCLTYVGCWSVEWASLGRCSEEPPVRGVKASWPPDVDGTEANFRPRDQPWPAEPRPRGRPNLGRVQRPSPGSRHRASGTQRRRWIDNEEEWKATRVHSDGLLSATTSIVRSLMISGITWTTSCQKTHNTQQHSLAVHGTPKRSSAIRCNGIADWRGTK